VDRDEQKQSPTGAGKLDLMIAGARNVDFSVDFWGNCFIIRARFGEIEWFGMKLNSGRIEVEGHPV